MAAVSRKIYFYQILERFSGEPISSADILAIWQNIHQITTVVGQSCTLTVGDGEYVRPWIDKHAAFPLRARFGKTKMNDTPFLEKQGNLRAITLQPDEGVNHLFHLIVFPSGVVGIEFNFYAPRLSSFAYYIDNICGIKVKFIPLLDRLTATKLNDLKSYSLLKIKLKSTALESARMSRGSIEEALNKLKDFSGLQEMELSLSVDGRGESRLEKGRIRQFIDKLRAGGKDTGVEKLILQGDSLSSGKIDSIDLINNVVHTSKNIQTQSSSRRVLHSSKAYEAIEEAHAELEDDIQSAISIE